MEASSAQPGRSCEVCGLAVGTYEPAVFVSASQVVHGSRAADPGLVRQPGLVTFHRDCYAAHACDTQLRAA